MNYKELFLEEIYKKLINFGAEKVSDYINIPKVGRLNAEGLLELNHDYDDTYFQILPIINDVRDYVKVYVESDDLLFNGEPTMYKKLIQFRDCMLAMKKMSDNSFQYVSWRILDSGPSLGYYFDDYREAKEHFAIRCNLINKERIFSDKEVILLLKFINPINDNMLSELSYDDEKTLKSLSDKIDNMILHISKKE